MAPRKKSDATTPANKPAEADTKTPTATDTNEKPSTSNSGQPDPAAGKAPEDTSPADKPAKAENKTSAAEEAKEKAAATSSAPPAPAPKPDTTPNTKPFEILCHVRLNGELFEPGDEITLTQTEFDQLKRNQAVAGSFD